MYLRRRRGREKIIFSCSSTHDSLLAVVLHPAANRKSPAEEDKEAGRFSKRSFPCSSPVYLSLGGRRREEKTVSSYS